MSTPQPDAVLSERDPLKEQHIREKSRRFSAGTCFVMLYASSYFLTELISVPLLWYFPLQRRWEWALTPSDGLLMGWYGKVLFSWLLASLGAGLLYAGLRWQRKILPAGVQGLLDLGAMSSVLFVLYYIARSLAYRIPQ